MKSFERYAFVGLVILGFVFFYPHTLDSLVALITDKAGTGKTFRSADQYALIRNEADRQIGRVEFGLNELQAEAAALNIDASVIVADISRILGEARDSLVQADAEHVKKNNKKSFDFLQDAYDSFDKIHWRFNAFAMIKNPPKELVRMAREINNAEALRDYFDTNRKGGKVLSDKIAQMEVQRDLLESLMGIYPRPPELTLYTVQFEGFLKEFNLEANKLRASKSKN